MLLKLRPATGVGPGTAGDAASGSAGAEEAAAVKTAFDVKIDKYDAASKIRSSRRCAR